MSPFRISKTTDKRRSQTRVPRSLSLFGIVIVSVAFAILLSMSNDIHSVRLFEATAPKEYHQRDLISSELRTPLYNNRGVRNAFVTTINHFWLSISGSIHRMNLLRVTNRNNTILYSKWYGAGFNEAYYESFGYFDDITNDQWDFKRERSRAFPVWYNLTNPNLRLAENEYRIFHIENVYPTFTCNHLTRVGGLDGEGPKWICDPHRLSKYKNCLIYSIGSDGDYKFEDAFIELLGHTNCEIHIFDPQSQFARPGDAKTNNIHYHAWGIGSDPNTTVEFKTFTETLKQLGHAHRRIDLLKIDCEGCEWSRYQDWLYSTADIRQISIETHSEKSKYAQIIPFFDDLFDQGYVLYSKEANTMPGLEPYGSFFEWSFIKLSKSFGKYGDGTPERLKLLTQRAAKNENYNENYQDALDDSYGFFDDITNADWRMKQQHAQYTPLFRKLSNPDYQRRKNPALWHMNNVYPTFACPNLLRVAGLSDGPKWICDPERLIKYDDCLIYSFGCDGNYMFEDAMIDLVGNKLCEIHVFDPNPDFARPNDALNKNIHYHAWGMGSSYSTTYEFGGYTFKSFPDIVKELGHDGRRIDIFKIDCEGCEWNSYKDWLTDSVDIRQIAIETHTVSAGTVSVGKFFKDIFSKGFVLYSKEANTWPNQTILQGNFFEWSFIKLKPSFSGADKPITTKSNEAVDLIQTLYKS